MEIESELVGGILATYVVGGVGLALLIAGWVAVRLLERAWRAVRRGRS